MANVLDIELIVPVTEHDPGYGAAILAMVGSGRFDSVKQGAEEFFKEKERISPNRELAALYTERYKKYQKIYPTVKNLFKEIKE